MESNLKTHNWTKGFFVLFIIIFTTATAAHNKVVVVPLFGDDIPSLSNVITVAKDGGDFNSPIDAMASINNASPNNPYVIVIAPGVYTISEILEVKPSVSIVGSGQTNTRIKNININVPVAMSLGEDNGDPSDVSNLTIENSSGGSGCTAISVNVGASVKLENVTAIASGCRGNTAILLGIASRDEFKNITVIASGGVIATGIVGDANEVRLEEIDVHVHSATAKNIGITAYFADLDIVDSRIRVSGSNSDLYGIQYSDISGVPSLVNSEVEVVLNSGSNVSFGIHLSDSTEMIIRRSTIIADSAALFTDSTSAITVSASTVVGGVGGTGNTGTKKCVASDNNQGLELTSLCL